MKADRNIDMVALYNVDIRSTGSRKIFITPQISFTHKNFTIYALKEIPLYQFVNGTQVVSQEQFTAGMSYRFFIKKKVKASKEETK